MDGKHFFFLATRIKRPHPDCCDKTENLALNNRENRSTLRAINPFPEY
jgi:hypothetical protein